MEVIVKNSQLSKTYISKMAYNHVNNILACNIDGNDTVLFFALDKDTMSFQELFKGMSKPPGSKISMAWSPDGRYLALGAHNVELWEYKEGRLKPVRSFQEDFVEIKIIQWSVDSQCYACGGISKTNTIKIRNIETGKVKQLQLPLGQTISSISFDPYGKYLLLQLRNNTIQVYSVINYQRYKSIKLSPQGLRINPIKETRQSSWSPEYSNFICPSLDDSRMNIAINLSRTKDFKSKNIFIGHCTSISCCKFSPKLYKWNGEITAIVAMGDSAGNVSIWRVGSKTSYEQPLLLSNSLQNSMEVVQDIEWDQKGDVLMVNMMKKYVHLIKFIDKQKYFGKELTNQQTTQLILETYGSNRATDVNKKEIEVFDFNVNSWDKIQQEEKKVDEPSSIQIQQISQIPNIPVQNIHFNTLKNTNHQQISAIYSQNKMEIQSEVPEAQTFIPNQTVTPPQTFRNVLPSILQNPVIHSSDSKGQFVKLSQQKVIIGKNNKKKIQPAMLVRKQQFTQMNMMKSQLSSPFNNQLNHFGQSQQLPSNTHYFMNPMVQTFPSLQLPLITFSQKQLTLPNHRLLEIKRLNKITQLQIQTLQQSSQVQAKFTRLFPSTIDYIFVTGKFLYVINQELLYVFDFQLGLKQLPLKVGKVNSFVANDQGLVAVIKCDGYMIAFDHVNNRNKTLAPVPLHLLMKQNFIQQNNAITKFNIKEFIITTNSDLFLTLSTQKTKNKSFLYDIKKNSWVQLSFRQGILTPGYSIKITDNQQAIVKNFFMGICPSLRQNVMSSQRVNNSMLIKNKNYGNAVITEEQEKLIYYLKYQPNKQKYYLALLQYIQSLKEARKNKQLRSLLHDYFFNAQGQKYIQNYEDRTQLMQKLKSKISGGVIDEFVLMERELENKLQIKINRLQDNLK